MGEDTRCPYHHSLEDACQDKGTIAVCNPFGDDAKVLMVCAGHVDKYVLAGWFPHKETHTDVKGSQSPQEDR